MKKKNKIVSKADLFSDMGMDSGEEVPEVEFNMEDITMGQAPDVEDSGYMETATDMGASALQSMSLEWMDDAIEAFSPESANEWRAYVAAARERSPTATTIGDILAPDLIDLVTAGGSKFLKIPNLIKALTRGGRASKFVSKADDVVEGAATAFARGYGGSAARQAGESEEASWDDILNMQNAGAGLIGGIVGGGTGALKNTDRATADLLGLNKDPMSMSARTGGKVGDVDEYTSGIAKNLRDMDMFGGRSSFDPIKDKFTSSGKIPGKKSNFLIPPSKHELLARAERLKKITASEINAIVGSTSGRTKSFKVKGGEKVPENMFSIKDFSSLKKTIVDAVAKSDKEKKAVGQMVDDYFFDLFRTKDAVKPSKLSMFGKTINRRVKGSTLGSPAEYNKAISISDMMDTRRALDEATMWSAKSLEGDSSLKQKVFKMLGSDVRTKLRDKIGSDRFESLNTRYGQVSDAVSGLSGRIGEKSQGSIVPASLFSYNQGVQAAQAANVAARGSSGGGIASSISDTLQNKGIGRGMNSAGEKIIPVHMRDRNANPQEESEQEAIPYRPQAGVMSGREKMDQVNIPGMVLKAKLGRHTQPIVDDPTLARYKMAQGAVDSVRTKIHKAAINGMGPELNDIPEEEIQMAAQNHYDDFKAVTEEPGGLAKYLPVMLQENPQMFEDDPLGLGRFDNKVPESKKRMASDIIMKSSRKGKTTHEMVADLSKLHDTSEYLG